MFFGEGLLSINKHADSIMMQIMASKKVTEAQIENITLLQSLFNYYSNIAVTIYDWKNLPASVNERFLNQVLYLFGEACFFEDAKLGYITLPFTTSGTYNMYYEPTAIHAYSFNIERNLAMGEFVVIRSNPTSTPRSLYVMQYVQRMADTLRTIDVLCKKLKQPFIILCDEKERLTYVNLIKNITDNEIMVLGVKDSDIRTSRFDIKTTEVNADLKQLWETYRNFENILLTTLGVNNTDTDKRERLIADEVNSNNMIIQMSTDVGLKELMAGCERVNERYGLNISVEAKGIDLYIPSFAPPRADYDNPEGVRNNG